MNSNYYDLAFVFYQTYFRTEDLYWLEQARKVARAWRDDRRQDLIERYLDGDRSVVDQLPTPRHLSTLGLAVFALESTDAKSRSLVALHARYVLDGWTEQYWDQRESAYVLMALVSATLLGHDHRKEAGEYLERILSAQKPSGQWDARSRLVSDKNGTPVPFTLNYMTGLLMEALIYYDRVIGDPRILLAIERSLSWLWSEQWVADSGAFQYGNVDQGGVHKTPAPVFNGLLVYAWGYAYQATGNEKYLEQGNAILRGLLAGEESRVRGVKQFAQVFRSCRRFLGSVSRSGEPTAASLVSSSVAAPSPRL